MALPSQREYEDREFRLAYAEMEKVRKAPLSERKEAGFEFFQAMRDDPKLVAERIEWLIAGNYGYGAMKHAKRVLGQSARANKVASLTQMIGSFEWHSPAAMTIAWWKKLTPDQKLSLDRAVRKAIKSAEAEKE
jgi:hypothetical protein